MFKILLDLQNNHTHVDLFTIKKKLKLSHYK
jgi:hypothetical protein